MKKHAKQLIILRWQWTKTGLIPEKVLGDDLSLSSSSIVPTVNVDLFITNTDHQLVLIWRDDKYCGKGWHIPSGCLRLKETLSERIENATQDEVGSPVIFYEDPIVFREDINNENIDWLDNQLERSHNISILYNCRLPESFIVDENENIKWISSVPGNLLLRHKLSYGDIIMKFFEGKTIS